MLESSWIICIIQNHSDKLLNWSPGSKGVIFVFVCISLNPFGAVNCFQDQIQYDAYSIEVNISKFVGEHPIIIKSKVWGTLWWFLCLKKWLILKMLTDIR